VGNFPGDSVHREGLPAPVPLLFRRKRAALREHVRHLCATSTPSRGPAPALPKRLEWFRRVILEAVDGIDRGRDRIESPRPLVAGAAEQGICLPSSLI
jgi:hypothetical protein